MWAQLITFRTKDGAGEQFVDINNRWEDEVGRGTDSGWARTLLFRSASDPNEWYEVAFFESEDKARANERSQQHLDILGQMMQLADGQPEYVDLTPVQENTR